MSEETIIKFLKVKEIARKNATEKAQGIVSVLTQDSKHNILCFCCCKIQKIVLFFLHRAAGRRRKLLFGRYVSWQVP